MPTRITHVSRADTLSLLRSHLSTTDFHFVDILQSTSISLCDNIFSSTTSFPYWFTDHGPSHSDRVLFLALHLSERFSNFVRPLNSIEILYLASACYLHDLGMVTVPPTLDLSNGYTRQVIETIRKKHPLAVKQLLSTHEKQFRPLLQLDRRAYNLLATLCESHASSLFNNRITILHRYSESDLRLDYVSRILLIADELDLTDLRAPVSHINYDSLAPSAKLHWLRHHYIVEAELDLPRLRLHFAFPGDDWLQYEGFARWTVDKLYSQCALVQSGLPASTKKVFDLDFQSVAADFHELDDRKTCPQSVMDELSRELQGVTTPQHKSATQIRVARPHQFVRRGTTIHPPSPIADRISDLFVDIFRSLNTFAYKDFLERAYVRIPDNDRVLDIISSRILEWVSGRLNTPGLPFSQTEPRRKIQFITGGTGVGKSTLIRYLLDIYLPQISDVYNKHCFWCIVDCIGKKSTLEVLRSALRYLSWCASHSIPDDELKILHDREIFIQESRIINLSEDDCREWLVSFMRALQFPKEILHTDAVTPRFAIFAFDNIDRISSFGVTADIYEFCLSLAKDTRSLILFPTRYSTKSDLEDRIDVITSRESLTVLPPKIKDIFEKRLDFGFDSTLTSDEIRLVQYKATFVGKGQVELELSDVRAALESALSLLIEHWEGHAIIPELAGNNIRSALDIFRRIMMSSHLTWNEFLALVHGEMTHPFRLLLCLMNGDHACYHHEYSPILNIFEPANTYGPYFARLNILNVGIDIASSVPNDNYVTVDSIISESKRRFGYEEAMVRRELWAMMAATYNLFELDHIDGRVPYRLLVEEKDLSPEFLVRVTYAGLFYRNNLINQFTYLQAISEDTLLPFDLANEICNTDNPTWKQRSDTCLRFLEYLRNQEMLERQFWPSRPRLGDELMMDRVIANARKQINRIEVASRHDESDAPLISTKREKLTMIDRLNK